MADTTDVRPLADLLATPEAVPDHWGPWRLNISTRELIPQQAPFHRIPLDHCTTSAGVLFWLCQITSKTWADDTTLAQFLRALDDILAPQVHLCPCGEDRALTRRQLRQIVKQRTAA